jgi:hypothetical protein
LAGYRDCRDGVYEAPHGKRVIALLSTGSDPAQWAAKIDTALRHESFRRAPIWSRYALVTVELPRTPSIALVAAAFCRDVSKCRRLVAFSDESSDDALPFLGLAAAPGGGGTPTQDLEQIVIRVLESPTLATAFLDENTATTHLQTLAEESEESS